MASGNETKGVVEIMRISRIQRASLVAATLMTVGASVSANAAPAPSPKTTTAAPSPKTTTAAPKTNTSQAPDAKKPGSKKELADSTKVSEADAKFIEKVSQAGQEFKYVDETKIEVQSTDQELQDKYGFSENEVKKLHQVVDQNNSGQTKTLQTGEGDFTTEDARILYLSHDALVAGIGASLVAAAEVSPAALAAAWTAFTATFSGPIAIGTAVLGSMFFADLAMKLTGAVVQGKGVAFYTRWGIPPLKAEIE